MGIDSSRLSIAAEQPAQPDTDANAYPTATASAGAVARTTAVASAGGGVKSFFGPDGPSFRDVLDTINPLNHIPIVSDIFASATGHEPSTASKLAGGAIFGGPIGLVASLTGVIFEDVNGKTPGNAVYAALTGSSSDTDTMVASNDAKPSAQMAKVDTAVEPVDATELASLDTASGSTNDAMTVANMQADAAQSAPVTPGSTGNPVLDLYGNSSSAHASYKKAQLLPYLRDVNTTKVM